MSELQIEHLDGDEFERPALGLNTHLQVNLNAREGGRERASERLDSGLFKVDSDPATDRPAVCVSELDLIQPTRGS